MGMAESAETEGKIGALPLEAKLPVAILARVDEPCGQ